MASKSISGDMPRGSIFGPDAAQGSDTLNFLEDQTNFSGRTIKQTAPKKPPAIKRTGGGSPAPGQTRNVKAFNNADRSLRKAVNRLLGELACQPDKVKPAKIAQYLHEINQAADKCAEADPGKDAHDIVKRNLDHALAIQTSNPGHIAENAKVFAGRAVASMGREIDTLNDLNVSLSGDREDPEQVKQTRAYKAFELTAKHLEATARARLAELEGPPPRPPAANHVDGQHHLRRLLTKDDLRARMGDRLTRKRMGFTHTSKTYKKIQSGLQTYQKKLAETQIQSSTASRWRQGAELKQMLDDIEANVDQCARQYAGNANAVRTMHALKEQIAAERSLIDDVVTFGHDKGFARQVADQKNTSLTDEAIILDKQRLTWANTTSLMAARAAIAGRATGNEMKIPSGQGFNAGAINKVDLVQYPDRIMVFKSDKLMEGNLTGRNLVDAGIDLANPRMGARNVATDIVAQHLGMDHLIPHTEFAEHDGKIGTVSDLAPGISPLQHGINIVPPDQEKFADMDEDELDQNGIKKMTGVIIRTGDDITDEKEIAALKKIDQSDLVSLGVEFKDGKYRRHDRVITNPLEKQRLAALPPEELERAGFAKRDSAFVSCDGVNVVLDTGDPNMRRDLCDAQWLDALTFQTDRHPGNMLFELDDDGKYRSLKLIDNDQAFGKDAQGTRLPYHELAGKDRLTVDKEPRALPVISREFKDQLDNINTDNLRSDLEGLLSREEIDATINRVQNLKTHANKLQGEGKVLSNDDWGEDNKVESLLAQTTKMPGKKDKIYTNNYLERVHNVHIYNRHLATVPPLLIARSEARLKAPTVGTVAE